MLSFVPLIQRDRVLLRINVKAFHRSLESWIFISFFSTYIAFFVAAGIFGGTVSDVMMTSAAIWLTAGLMVMQMMGTFEVTIGGEPYKLVYKEVPGEAHWANLNDYEYRPKTIENHLVHNQTLADSLAYRELVREKVKQCPRNLTLPFDPFLQPTDIIELPDGSRYYITSIPKTLSRNKDPLNMQVSALMIRSGKEYNNTAGFSEY